MDTTGLGFLIVDDDAFLRLTTKNMLRDFTSRPVLEASNGVEALEILKDASHAIDIILCDLNMPGMDGLQFLRHLGEARSNVSVAVISSHDDSLIASVKKMAIAYGVRLLGSAQKPLTSEHIFSFVNAHSPPQAKKYKPQTAAPDFTIAEILQGLANRQFEPFYQPKLDLQDYHIRGAEALARWIHPEYGIITPYSFIQTLEKSGNIDGLTFVILEKSAAACRQLHDLGYPLTMSVNLSLNSLTDPDLADKITKTVLDAGIDPKYIVLEITESATMTDVAHSLENLARLRMHGFGLSIDDYGTGSSNIQQITRVAFSELKIDQSFVKGCNDNKELSVVVTSSIEMAHKLKMECIAEGVETRFDWDALKGMGCDTAQGYYIARPMNLSAFIDFCSSYKPERLFAAQQ